MNVRRIAIFSLLLFGAQLVAPALHVLHEHDAHAGTTWQDTLGQDCPGGCGDPEHAHGPGHDHRDCPTCKLALSFVSLAPGQARLDDSPEGRCTPPETAATSRWLNGLLSRARAPPTA
jgi:hypothetical protein